MEWPKGGGFTRKLLVSFLGLYILLSMSTSIAQETEEIEEIEVIGITPTHGVGFPENLNFFYLFRFLQLLTFWSVVRASTRFQQILRLLQSNARKFPR